MTDVLDGRARTIVLDAATEQVAVARRFVRRTLDGVVPDDVAADLQLIVSELFSNAVEHGDAERVTVRLELQPGTAEVTVDSESPAPDVGPVASWRVPDEDAVNGRGLGIVRSIADVVHVAREPGRFVVTAGRTFATDGRPDE